MKTKQAPTVKQAGTYQGLFEYFNRELFGGELPACFLNFSRLSKSYGFFQANVWQDSTAANVVAGDCLHEISLNPDFLFRPAREALSTLVHEMAHLWQEYHGSPPRKCYHDREFAAKMEAIGLMTSNTGAPGGKRTGQHMTHYVIDGGRYAEAFDAIPADLLLPWRTRQYDATEKAKRKKKAKRAYVCAGCEAKVWGKPGLSIACGECEESFTEQE